MNYLTKQDILVIFRSFSSFPHQVYLLGIDHFEICKQNGMSKSQTILCEKKGLLDEMSSFAHGAKLATDECKFQFQYNRWNCSIPKLHEDNLFWRVQNQGKLQNILAGL